MAWRDGRAVDFRQVQGALAGTGVTNVLAGLASAVPNISNPGAVAYTQTTGVAARRVGYCMGGLFILVALLPKVSGLLSTIRPGDGGIPHRAVGRPVCRGSADCHPV